MYVCITMGADTAGKKPHRRGRLPRPPIAERVPSPLAVGLKRILQERSLSALALSKRCGLSGDFVRNIIAGRSGSPAGEAVARIASELGVSVESLLAGDPSSSAPTGREAPGMAQVTEVDWLATPGGSPHPASKLRVLHGETWTVPVSALGGRDPRSLVLYRAQEDVAGVRRGDILLLDTRSPLPSPPGVFVTWDGIGVAVARCTYVRHEDGGRVRVEGSGEPYEAPLSTAPDLLGRVVARWGPL